MTRASGILLHPTSLPGPYGIGEFGAEAVGFLDFLVKSGQRLWQVLPLHPTGAGNSPYQAPSAFAGNPLLISLDRLTREGLLAPEALRKAPEFPVDSVDYEAVTAFKMDVLRRAYARFEPDSAFHRFCERNSYWLDDYALFMALLEAHEGAVWTEWEPAVSLRQAEGIRKAREELASEVCFHKFLQHLFFEHYGDVRREASSRGIRIIGDLPIFVAHNSADVWAHPQLFYLDSTGRPSAVAGVPPDYFSATGQLWGNPLYNWEALAGEGYSWWVDRIKVSLTLYDMVRIDHFRGFESYWRVEAGQQTAMEGRWVRGPGTNLFKALEARLGDLPIIAEDLGMITPAVETLRDELGLPGMKVLQFAFNNPENPYLPHNHVRSCVVYTGTHDNDTTRGWWSSASRDEKRFARRYLDCRGRDMTWALIRVALRSVADTALIPMQDILDLGTEARMNVPGLETGNWTWRFDPAGLTDETQKRLLELTVLYDRARAGEPQQALPELEH